MLSYQFLQPCEANTHLTTLQNWYTVLKMQTRNMQTQQVLRFSRFPSQHLEESCSDVLDGLTDKKVKLCQMPHLTLQESWSNGLRTPVFLFWIGPMFSRLEPYRTCVRTRELFETIYSSDTFRRVLGCKAAGSFINGTIKFITLKSFRFHARNRTQTWHSSP